MSGEKAYHLHSCFSQLCLPTDTLLQAITQKSLQTYSENGRSHWVSTFYWMYLHAVHYDPHIQTGLRQFSRHRKESKSCASNLFQATSQKRKSHMVISMPQLCMYTFATLSEYFSIFNQLSWLNLLHFHRNTTLSNESGCTASPWVCHEAVTWSILPLITWWSGHPRTSLPIDSCTCTSN